MKASLVLSVFGLGSLTMAAPLKEKKPEQTPNPARMPYWFLTNCTGGWRDWCVQRRTECLGSWPTSNDQWCELNCDCEWWDGCSDFACIKQGSEDEVDTTAENGDTASKA